MNPAARLLPFVLPAAVLLALFGWTRLAIETDVLDMLPGEIPEVEALRLARDAFDGGADLLVGIRADDETRATAAAREMAARLEARPDLVRQVRTSAVDLSEQASPGEVPPAVAALAWALQNASAERWREVRQSLEGDENLQSQLEQAIDRLGAEMDVAQLQQLAYDPLGLLRCLDPRQLAALQNALHGLASADGRFQLLMVSPAAAAMDYRAGARWLEEIAPLLSHPDAEVRWTGEPAFAAEIGSNIQRDMSGTIGYTELLIALLFWLMFRSLRSLIWIQALLVLCLFLTLGFGGLLIGRLSIMSLGFAAIVLGIVVDYAVLILQEAAQHPGLTAAELRRRAAPGILAGGLATALVFLSLLLSRLSALAELGVLVATGVIVGLAVMLGFAPYFSTRIRLPGAPRSAGDGAFFFAKRKPALAATVLLVAGMAAILAAGGLPGFRAGSEALRPRHSSALEAFEWIQQQLGDGGTVTVPILITGPEADIQERAAQAARSLQAAGWGEHLVLPAALAPAPQSQAQTLPHIQWLIANQARLESAVAEAGFTEEALALFRGLCGVWSASLAADPPRWPQTVAEAAGAPWLRYFVADSASLQAAGLSVQPEQAALLGSVRLPARDGAMDLTALEKLQQILQATPGAATADWQTLGLALSAKIRRDFPLQLLPVLGALIVTLLVTFRRAREVFLCVAVLAFGLAALAATMRLAGVSWNLASLAAIPLLLGTGLDYTIHILLALRRAPGQPGFVQRTTGRAVFFSGMTTVIAFSSLLISGNQGLASLGWVCCVGTAWVLLFTLWLLPHWYQFFQRGEGEMAQTLNDCLIPEGSKLVARDEIPG